MSSVRAFFLIRRLGGYACWPGLIFALAVVFSAVAGENPVEVGSVNWGRDHAKALEDSRKSGKPVLILFQEVPGCVGCKRFGAEVLTHPLIVEVIEDEFIPLLVFNNKGGSDRDLVRQYGEKPWNYQTIRFLDAGGNDLIPVVGSLHNTGVTAARICKALEAADKPVPAYIRGVAQAHPTKGLSSVDFAMFCFWTGEMKLGSLDSAVRTEVGWFDGREVTRVWYDESTTSLTALIATASTLNKCADTVYVPGKALESVKAIEALRFKVKATGDVAAPYKTARASDQKKQIQKSLYMKLSLTEHQLTRVNAFARRDPEKARGYLSPRQLKALANMREVSQEAP